MVSDSGTAAGGGAKVVGADMPEGMIAVRIEIGGEEFLAVNRVPAPRSARLDLDEVRVEP
jgi:hypothetical protein